MNYKYGLYSPEKGWDIFSRCARQLARLQLYHLANSLRAGDRPAECVPTPPAGRTLVEFAAAAWTPFYSYYFRDPAGTGNHREGAWLAFASALEAALADTQRDLARLCEHAYRSLLEAHVEKDLLRQREKWVEPCPFGAFAYEPHEPYVALHFYNVYVPQSPFAQPGRLLESLRSIVADIDRRGLSIARIGIDSWVTGLAPFQALFPAEFVASITPTDADNKGGWGWWGQYILRTGEFNEVRAERLRQTRKFDFARAHAECDFEAFRRHILPAGGQTE